MAIWIDSNVLDIYDYEDNWDPADVPDRPGETAIFTNNDAPTAVRINSARNVTSPDGFTFDAGAPTFTISLIGDAVPANLQFVGAGIVNNSGVAQNLSMGDSTQIGFHASSTAGNATITVGPRSQLLFFDTSSGGTARIIGNGGTVVLATSSGARSIGSLEGSGFVVASIAPYKYPEYSSGAAASVLTVGSLNTSTTYSGSLIDDNSIFDHVATLGLTKVGTGTLVLSGNSTYTGVTTINGGTLQVDGTLTSSIILNSGGTLAGVGTIPRVYASASYVLAAGAHIGTLSTTNSLATTAIDLGGNELANRIYGNAGANTLSGGDGADFLLGQAGDDVLNGGSGDDKLYGGSRQNDMAGGTGNDWYIVNSLTDVIVEAAGEGTKDRVWTTLNYTLTAGAHVELMSPTTIFTGAINLTGNELANTIYGNNNVNILNGGGGADTLRGLGGNDTYIIDNAADVIVDTAGIDNANTSVTYALGAGVAVETLRTTNAAGTAKINLTGNELNNIVTGNAGNNQLNGRAGNDKLTGNGGADLFFFNTALNAATNVDTIIDYNVVQDTIRLENAIFIGLAAGVLDPDAFHKGASAADAEDRIIYNSANGALSYDSNGNAAGGMIKFAQLTAGLALTNADFVVV